MSKISRREFLKGSLVVTGSACCSAALGGLGSQVVWAQSAGGNGKTIVVVHLDGGNDWHQSFDVAKTTGARSAYAQVHSASAVDANLVLSTANGYGLHPVLGDGPLGGLHQLFLDGNVRVMRRVGTENPSRSHGTEQRKFESGGRTDGLGWMGRALDGAAGQGGSVSRFAAVAVGDGNPRDIQGSLVRGLGLRSVSGYNLDRQSNVNDQLYRQFIHKQTLAGAAASTEIATSRIEGQNKMYDAIATMKDASTGFSGRGQSANLMVDAYSNRSPGPQLQQIAMLIQAGVGTQLALCSVGGFDLHSNIGNEVGSEATLMGRINQSIAAFMADMTAFGKQNDVTVVFDSEFGRTIQENGSEGTDHGVANALVAVGGAVNGGVSGAPVTGDEFLRNSSRPKWIPVTYHFANVYKECLSWAGLPSNVFGDHTDFNFNLLS